MNFIKFYTGYSRGLNNQIYQIKMSLRAGMPIFEVLNAPIRYNRGFQLKLKSVFQYTGFKYPAGTITVSLQDIASGYSSVLLEENSISFLEKLEFPFTVGLLILSNQIQFPGWENCFSAGALDLEGNIIGQKSYKALITSALKNNIQSFLLPLSSRNHIKVFSSKCNIAFSDNLADFQEKTKSFLQKTFLGNSFEDYFSAEKNVNNLINDIQLEPVKISSTEEKLETKLELNFSDVVGQESAKHALMIAAAGKHSVIFFGPPGCGKTMLGIRYPGILPKPTLEESSEIEQIQEEAEQLANSQNQYNSVQGERPVRQPHHSSSNISLIGGSSKLNAGEVTLAHGGLLFLDELGHFDMQAIQVLREVLTHRKISLARASGRIVYPANFWFLGALNLCPCGFLGHPVFNCRCSRKSRMSFLRKINGPFMDRMDLQQGLSLLPLSTLKQDARTSLSTELMKKKVQTARHIQRKRFSGLDFQYNAEIPDNYINHFTKISTRNWEIFRDDYLEKETLSFREINSLRKTARTIADLDGKESIELEHLLTALSYKGFRKEMNILHGNYEEAF